MGSVGSVCFLLSLWEKCLMSICISVVMDVSLGRVDNLL